MTVYDFEATDNKGTNVRLSDYQGKVLLIVNTATKCGLTPQYEALEAVYQQYKDKGLVVLDFPCNQFLEQAPGTDGEIDSFCTLTYNTTFPRFSKVDVNGDNAHPLFKWLREQAPTDIGDEETKAFEQKVAPLRGEGEAWDIKWNFGKFLIDRDGKVAARYSPAIAPDKLAQAIETSLEGGNR